VRPTAPSTQCGRARALSPARGAAASRRARRAYIRGAGARETSLAAPETASYTWRSAAEHLLAHLRAAGQRDEASALAFRLPWLQFMLWRRGAFALVDDLNFMRCNDIAAFTTPASA